MPRPTLLVNPADYPLDKVLLDQEGCKGLIPQRFEFLQVTSVLASLAKEKIIVVHRHLDDDEFWIRGHIPGRPVLPGVLMVESMAQVAALQSRLQYDSDHDKFIGFGGVDRIRFRSMVVPGDDILIVGPRLQRLPVWNPRHGKGPHGGQAVGPVAAAVRSSE